MSLLSDFFIANPIEVQSFDAEKSPLKSFPTIQAKSIEIIKLIQLQRILDGSPFNDLIKDLDALTIRTVSDDGPWVILVPEIVVNSLAQADEHDLIQYGEAWASTEEWILDHGKTDDVIALIKDIAALARKTKDQEQNMYLWVSL